MCVMQVNRCDLAVIGFTSNIISPTKSVQRTHLYILEQKARVLYCYTITIYVAIFRVAKNYIVSCILRVVLYWGNFLVHIVRIKPFKMDL